MKFFFEETFFERLIQKDIKEFNLIQRERNIAILRTVISSINLELNPELNQDFDFDFVDLPVLIF